MITIRTESKYKCGGEKVTLEETHTSLAKYDVTGCLCAELWTNAMIMGLKRLFGSRRARAGGDKKEGGGGGKTTQNYTVSSASEK